MSLKHKSKRHYPASPAEPKKKSFTPLIVTVVVIIAVVVTFALLNNNATTEEESSVVTAQTSATESQLRKTETKNKWFERAFEVTNLFHIVYTPCWEGAYGAIGDAYLFKATGDSALFRYHFYENDMRRMCEGTWVDDRAWVCMAELIWWDFTGRQNNWLVQDAKQRYLSAKEEGRLSNHEGFWSWYNWSPAHRVNEPIFSNGAINQMATVACLLYDATRDQQFLDDALLVWNGDKKYPGVEKLLYKGNGVWEGRPGRAAFGKQVAWKGAEYCAVGAALYRVTKDEKYRKIVIETARHILDPANGWVDPQDFYQVHMDGNGAFVNFLLDAYSIAPDSLSDMLPKIEKMLEHVWTNNHGMAKLTLHRGSDHGIRNGWNPNGGEDGYNVGEVGTVHAQGEAARAFGVFAYYYLKNIDKSK